MLLATGVFGENRVQEAAMRWEPRRQRYQDLRLHLIGPLQTNKVADAVAMFDVIEVVDRPKLASRISSRNGPAKPASCLIYSGQYR